MIVKCRECGEDHNPKEVEFLNIEEDIHGRDVMEFICPVTKHPIKSLVYNN